MKSAVWAMVSFAVIASFCLLISLTYLSVTDQYEKIDAIFNYVHRALPFFPEKSGATRLRESLANFEEKVSAGRLKQTIKISSALDDARKKNMKTAYTDLLDIIDTAGSPGDIKSQYISGITMVIYSKAERVCFWAGGDVAVQKAKFPSWVDLLQAADVSQEKQKEIWGGLRQKAENCHSQFKNSVSQGKS